jgi:hypothetical protein
MLVNGGTDLEHFQFHQKHGWQQALAVISQVIATISLAEQAAEFEVSKFKVQENLQTEFRVPSA